MRRKKKFYKIVYKQLNTYMTIIEAKDEFEALRKFKKETIYGYHPCIISFEEYKIDKQCLVETPQFDYELLEKTWCNG